jgi:2,4-dienoyl-CoA reductase (NADPH2)
MVATGVTPRDPKIPGQEHPKVLSYIDVLRHRKPVGERVAIIGAGGIGFDVAEFLVHDGHSTTHRPGGLAGRVGRDRPGAGPGGLSPERPQVSPPARKVTLLQRKKGKPGAGTGQDHRLDSPHDAEDEAGGNDRRRELRTHHR